MNMRTSMPIKTAITVCAMVSCLLARPEGVRIQETGIHDVRIVVLGLFHPREFTLSAADADALVLRAGQETFVLEKSSGAHIAQLRALGPVIVVRVGTHLVRTAELNVTGRAGGPADFSLTVPGKITRHYRGTLELKPAASGLVAVVHMDLETGVASVVAAESLPGTPIDALKAQAVATRSYFVAG